MASEDALDRDVLFRKMKAKAENKVRASVLDFVIWNEDFVLVDVLVLLFPCGNFRQFRFHRSVVST